MTGGMTSSVRMRLLALAAVLSIAVSVWAAVEVQRATARDALEEASSAEAMLISMLDQETGLRGYLQTGDEMFLEPYSQGRRNFELALSQVRASVEDGETAERRAVASQEGFARRWQASAERAITARHRDPAHSAAVGETRDRKLIMDRFRAANRSHKRTVAEERLDRQLFAEVAAVIIAVVLSGLFCVVGHLTVVRPWRRIADRDRRQRRFAEEIQLTGSEAEAYETLQRQLEQSIDGSRVTVLSRDHEETSTAAGGPAKVTVPSESPTLRAAGACLAIRGGKPYVRDASEPSALACAVCGEQATASTCVPSLVGGEVIGAVLAVHPRRLRAAELDELITTVAQAAPNVANLRNLAAAERQALTDSLTGLANARALQDSLKRLAAQAGRTSEPLTAVMVDLDHFKSINDTFGHQRGDQVLAAVGDLLAGEVRASDFVGRYGGEEFVLLLPHTGREGGIELAEKLRGQIRDLNVRGLDRQLSASFGVAVLPDDAGHWSDLIRCADRALYAAKAGGRNRVTPFRQHSPAPAGTREAP